MASDNQEIKEIMEDIETKCNKLLLKEYESCKMNHSEEIKYWKDINDTKCYDVYIKDLKLCYDYYKKNYTQLPEKQREINDYNFNSIVKNKYGLHPYDPYY